MCLNGCHASGTVGERLCDCGIGEPTGESWTGRKISRPFFQRRHDYRIGGNALPYAPAFIGTEEESLVLTDGAAEGSTEVVLLEIRRRRVEVALGVEYVVPEEL